MSPCHMLSSSFIYCSVSICSALQPKGSLRDQTQSRQDTLVVINPRSYLARYRHVALLDLSSKTSIWTKSSKGGPGFDVHHPWVWVL